MTPNVIILITVIWIALIALSLWYRLTQKTVKPKVVTYTPPPRMEIISPTLMAVMYEYRHMVELIQGSATLPELTYLQNEVFEWLDSYKGLANITEYFTDLMSEIETRELQLRGNKLSA